MMFNLRRFLYMAVASSEPDLENKVALAVEHDNHPDEKGTWLSSPPRPHVTVRDAKATRCPSLVVKALLLTSIITFTGFFLGQPIAQFAALAYHGIVIHCGSGPHTTPGGTSIPTATSTPSHGNHHHGPGPSYEPIIQPAAKPWGAALVTDRSGWKVDCSSGKESCKFAVDGDPKSAWRSDNVSAGVPHWISIDLGREVFMHTLGVTSQRTGQGGEVRKHRVDVRRTEQEPWLAVARGTWRDRDGFGDRAPTAMFEPRTIRHVRLWIVDTYKTTNYTAISDINVWTLPPPAPDSVDGEGRWNETLDFPLVPVTAWLNPRTGRLVTVSSYAYNNYQANRKPPRTLMAEWDPTSGTITEQLLDTVGHDVFCPGTSMDEKGRVIFTGGSTPDVYSIYSPDDTSGGAWVQPKNNSIAKARGYQGQTYLSDGRTFMIGGSWSGGSSQEDREAEVFDPTTATWTLISNKSIPVDLIKMSPGKCAPTSVQVPQCVNREWRQHHPWLFAWKNATVFHAGPSRQMNWFLLSRDNEPSFKDAGFRGDDTDAVGGCAVLYDAVAGSVLTAGGAPNYHYWVKVDDKNNKAFRFPATNNVFGITIPTTSSSPDDGKVTVTPLSKMKHARVFANAAILPTGEIFVVGGELQGEPFHDDTWVATPEIYSPSTNTWRDAARHSIPRPYHSWALLLPDATVLVGGGGLKSDHEDSNHYDAQIYQPSYLFTTTTGGGKQELAVRPVILNNEIAEYKLGTDRNMEIHTDGPVDLVGSLIRYSATTHALNNDLRRIPVRLVPQSQTHEKRGNNLYTIEIPAEEGVALPGYWMLFVLRDGVPSKAKTVRLFKG